MANVGNTISLPENRNIMIGYGANNIPTTGWNCLLSSSGNLLGSGNQNVVIGGEYPPPANPEEDYLERNSPSPFGRE